MKKRILAFLMCLCLCVSLLPAAALADETETYAVYLTVNYPADYTGVKAGGLNIYDENGAYLGEYNESTVIKVPVGEMLIVRAIEMKDLSLAQSWSNCGDMEINGEIFIGFEESGSVELNYIVNNGVDSGEDGEKEDDNEDKVEDGGISEGDSIVEMSPATEDFEIRISVSYPEGYEGSAGGFYRVDENNEPYGELLTDGDVVQVKAGELPTFRIVDIEGMGYNMTSNGVWRPSRDEEYSYVKISGVRETKYATLEIIYTSGDGEGGPGEGEGDGGEGDIEDPDTAGYYEICVSVNYPDDYEGADIGGFYLVDESYEPSGERLGDGAVLRVSADERPVLRILDIDGYGRKTLISGDFRSFNEDGYSYLQVNEAASGEQLVLVVSYMTGPSTGGDEEDAGSGFQWNGQTEVWSILPTTGAQGLIWITDAMGAAMEAEGWTYVKKDAQGNPMTQAQFFEDAVAAGNVGAIMCAAMDVNMLEEVAAAAYEAGIAVAYLGAEPEYPVAGCFYSAYDITGIFAVWAAENWVINRVAEGGNVPTDPDGMYEVAIDTYYGIRDGVLRSNAIVETLEASGILTCVAETSSYGVDAYTNAYDNAMDCLETNPNCHIFIAYEPEMALGMADAIAEHCAENGLDLADYCVIPCYGEDVDLLAAYQAACEDASASAVKGYATYGDSALPYGEESAAELGAVYDAVAAYAQETYAGAPVIIPPFITGARLADILLSACDTKGYDHPFGATYYDPVWAVNIYGWAQSWQMGEDYPTMGGGSASGGPDLSGITIRFADEPEDHARPDGGLIGSSVLGEHYITVMVDGEPVTDFTVTSSDKSVCTVKNDNGTLVVKALNYGVSTLTITTDDMRAQIDWASEPAPGPEGPGVPGEMVPAEEDFELRVEIAYPEDYTGEKTAGLVRVDEDYNPISELYGDGSVIQIKAGELPIFEVQAMLIDGMFSITDYTGNGYLSEDDGVLYLRTNGVGPTGDAVFSMNYTEAVEPDELDAVIVHDGEVFPEANAALQNEEITVTEISSDEDGSVLELSGSDIWMEVYTNDPDRLQAVLNDENTQVMVTYGFDTVSESELSETDAAALEALKQSAEPGMDSTYMTYVELSAVLAVIDEEHGFGIYGDVQELSEAASFCMQVSKSALEAVGRDIKHLSVVRVHDGVAEKLWEFGDKYEETPDGYNLFFTTDRFSTYALMYDRVVGDINGDDVAMNALDVVSMMKYVLGEGNTVVQGSVDVNGDREVDILDVIRLMRKISGEDVAIN